MNEKTDSTQKDRSWENLIKVGGIAALLQFGYIIIVMVIELPLSMTTEYLPLNSALDYFTLINSDRLLAIFLLDVPMILFFVLTYFSSFGIYAVLKKRNEAYMILFTAFIFVATTLGIVTNEIFSLFHLSDRYFAATEEVKPQILAAGEAIIANNVWNSTAGYITGFLLLGSLLLISVTMLQGKEFSRRTIHIGIICVGLDLLQHVIHIFVPSIAAPILMIAGLFYFPWYLFLGLDLLRLGKTTEIEKLD